MALSFSSSRAGAGLWQRALDLVFPPRCVGCEAFGALICETCATMMLPAAPPRCETCWTPSDDGSCYRCRLDRPAFEMLRSAFVYDGPARQAVLALKFKGLSSIAPLMAEALAERFAEWGPQVSAIVPVPLAPGRKRERGYDQAELLARELSRLTGVPVERRALTRRRATAPQALQGDELSRRRNVRAAFGPGRRRVLGPVLLVDDVVTTGATLDACARVLIDEGAGPVYAMTFARED